MHLPRTFVLLALAACAGCTRMSTDRKDERARLEAGYGSYTLFEVRGCDVAKLMACTHGEQLGANSSSTVVVCQEKPLPGGS